MKKKKMGYLKYVIFHPIKGYEELKYDKAGSLPIAMGILIIWFFSKIIERQATGFIHNTNNPETLNIFFILLKTIILFLFWCISNWAFCTLMDGKGTFRDIWISCAYALVPMLASVFASTVLSNFITHDEAIFCTMLLLFGYGWTGFLIFNALSTIHDYTLGKTLASVMLTLLGMLCIIFVIVLSLNLYKQVFDLGWSILNEIQLRL